MNSERFTEMNKQRIKDIDGDIRRIVYFIRKGGEGTFAVYLDANDHLIYVRNVGRYKGREEYLAEQGAMLVGVYSCYVTIDILREDVKEALYETLWNEMDLTRKYNV